MTERVSMAAERRLFLVGFALLLVILWAARGVLAPFVIAGGLAYAFAPLVSSAERRTRWPRAAIVGIAYLVLLAGVAALAYATAGGITHELVALSAAGPDLVATALREVLRADSLAVGGMTITVTDIATAVRNAASGILASPSSAIEIARVAVDVALNAVLVVIVSFYLLVDARRIHDGVLGLVPTADRPRVDAVVDHIQETLAKWLRGQLLLIALVAVVAYLFLGPLLHVRYALAIGVLTGILEIIPLVGPVVAALIAMTAALVSGGPTTALIVLVGYFVIRQVEDQVVMPVVIGRAVHLHPVVTIFAVLAGLSIYGVIGGLLAVPIAAAVNVVVTDVYTAPRASQSAPANSAEVARAETPNPARPAVVDAPGANPDNLTRD